MADKKNDAPVDEVTENDMSGDIIGAFMAGQAGNPKPDTAQGVAELVNLLKSDIEEHARVQFGEFESADGETVPVAVYPDGRFEIVPRKQIDAEMSKPSFRRGVATLTSLSSFIGHVQRFGDGDSAVFARDDVLNPGLLAVLDYHRADKDGEHGDYRHGLHRAKFDFPVSDEWKTWVGMNKEVMTMRDFAAFLEDNVLDVAEMGDDVPESAERFVNMLGGAKNIADWSMLTALAKSLSVFGSASVTEVTDLQGGAVNLTISEEHDTEIEGIKATVPTMFFIAIPIFRDGQYYRLPVRLRYRRQRGGVTFHYEMWGSDRAFMDAIKDAVNRVDDETEAQCFYGLPEA